jgi:DNA polymerase-1
MEAVVDISPTQFGAVLTVDSDDAVNLSEELLAIDAETDEHDGFVGLGLCGSAGAVTYRPVLTPHLKSLLGTKKLVGHNLKSDAHWLKGWGVQLDPANFVWDTMVAQHVMDSTTEHLGLKALAKSLLGMEWPTYKEMVGKGKKRLTLDKQPVERVANYCGMDTLATWKLYQWQLAHMTEEQKRYMDEVQMPLLRTLWKMESKGALLDVAYLQDLDARFLGEMQSLEKFFPEGLNIRSPKQLLEALKARGINVPSTDIGTLKQYREADPFVDMLLKYREVQKLRSTYTNALLELPSLPYVHTTYKSTGTVTGRLSSAEPNLQNIPTRTETGALIRKAFIAPKHYVAADYSQIEYRMLAHFSMEPVLLEAFHANKDVHDQTALALGLTRGMGKTLNFASIYGAQAPKIAETAGISVEDAQQFLDLYWSKLPHVAAWISKARWLARQQGGVKTLLGRFIPLPDINSRNRWDRQSAERHAVSYIVQGSAFEIVLMAMLALDEAGFDMRVQVHDEVGFYLNGIDEKTLGSIRQIMTGVMKLNVPLEVEIGTGKNWAEAK